MRKFKILALVLAFAMMFSIVAACAGDDTPAPAPAPAPAPEAPAAPPAETPGDSPVLAAPEETVQDTLTVVVGALPVDLLPWGQNDNPSAQGRKQIFDTLFNLDYNTFEVIPELSLAVN